MKLVPVILSGGAGTRLWPLSRELLPKQLLALTGERTMLQETAARLAGFPEATGPVVVCNEAHRFLVAEQLREMELAPTAILLEPVGRNTAPAIALAAHSARRSTGEDALLLVLAGRPRAAAIWRPFRRRPAGDGRCRGRAARGLRHRGARSRDRLRLHTARPGQGRGASHRPFRREAGSGRARANSLPRASTSGTPACSCSARGASSTSSRVYAPDIADVCARASAAAVRDTDFTRVDAAVFASCRSDSVDYAVMEKTRDAVMVPLDAGWNDVGSWAALHDVLPADAQGNVARGDVLLEDTTNCYVHADSRLVAALGLHDMVIVETADAVMVAPKAKVQDVKKLVARIKAAGRLEHVAHATERKNLK